MLISATRPDGADTIDARLIIDGNLVSERVPTTSVDLDPGEHTIRLEGHGAGSRDPGFELRSSRRTSTASVVLEVDGLRARSP